MPRPWPAVRLAGATSTEGEPMNRAGHIRELKSRLGLGVLESWTFMVKFVEIHEAMEFGSIHRCTIYNPVIIRSKIPIVMLVV